MYTEHFKLSKPLFDDGLARDGQFYSSNRLKMLQANLTIALTRRDSAAVIYGPAGTGKTTTALHTMRAMATQLALGAITHRPLSAHELLEQLLTEFGFSPYKNSRTERLQIWRQFLDEMSVTGTRVCIVVENTQDLSLEVLESLDALTSANASGGSGANIVLTGRSSSATLLTASELAALRQRIRLQTTIQPLTSAETLEYLQFKVEGAGGHYDQVFAPDAGQAIHSYSGGVFRLIDNVVESCLSIGALRKEARVNAALVSRVAVGLFGIPEAANGDPASEPGDPSESEAPSAEVPSSVSTAAVSPSKAPNLPQSDAVVPTVTPEVSASGSEVPAANLPDTDDALPAEPTGSQTDSHTIEIEQPPARTAPAAAAEAKVALGPNASTPERAPVAPSLTPSAETPKPASAGPDRPMPAEATAAAPSAAPAPKADGVAYKTESPRATGSAAAPRASEPPRPPGPNQSASGPSTAGRPVLAKEPEAKPARASAPLEFEDIDATGSIELNLEAMLEPSSLPADPEDDGAGESGAATGGDARESDALPVLMDSIENDDGMLDWDETDASVIERVPRLEDIFDPASMTIDTEALDDEISDEDRQQIEMLEAFATAEALEDISNSMAETLFGDAELDQLAAALAVESGPDAAAESDDPASTSGERRIAGGSRNR